MTDLGREDGGVFAYGAAQRLALQLGGEEGF